MADQGAYPMPYDSPRSCQHYDEVAERQPGHVVAL